VTRERTQVAIVGAGPAGLTLAQLLHRAGVESVVLENRNRDYVEHRVRAGVLEQGTVEVLTGAGVGERMHREGIVHRGVNMQFAGERHRLAFDELTGGGTILVYGQTEVVKDLIAARLAAGLPLVFEVAGVAVHDFESDAPSVTYTHEGEAHRLVHARVPVRLARDPRRGRTVERGARLRAPRARVRAAQPPLADPQPALRAMPA